MTPTVLVTGGAGYVGSHACKALAAAGFVPVTYDNLSTGHRWAVRWGPFELGDVRDPARIEATLRRHHAVAVLHFAAVALVGESMRDPGPYYDINVMGTLRVLEACRAARINLLVLSSSCATYGLPERLPITEGAGQHPISPYGMSKLMAERIVADFGRAHAIAHATLRYFNAAGADPAGEIGEAREVETHLIPLALDAVRGVRPPVTVMGTDYPTADGTAVRDYVHVADLADAHVAALRRLLATEGSMVLNLGVGQGHSVFEVLRTAEAVTGRSVPHRRAPRREGDPAELVADANLARATLGLTFARSRSLHAIIRDAWRWHEGRGQARVA